ncbi:nucleotide-diphospho-sugar transferase [Zopfochytrium polystomum]|nr:nucleotide-diphospho-sugar transferase [Zopfochytrium polystomum]
MLEKTAVLFLAAGYGTRLQRDLLQLPADDELARLVNVPKALLPLAGKPLIDHWLDLIASKPASGTDASELDTFIICNDANVKQFVEWAKGRSFPLNRIFSDGSTSNENRRGAVQDIHFMDAAKKIQPDSLVTCYRVSDEETRKFGIIELDAAVDHPLVNGASRIVGFKEKPGPEASKSRLACPCFYFFSAPTLPHVLQFLQAARKENGKLEEIDATGKFLAWVIHRSSVWALPVSGRLDIGGLSSFIEANKYLSGGLSS